MSYARLCQSMYIRDMDASYDKVERLPISVVRLVLHIRTVCPGRPWVEMVSDLFHDTMNYLLLDNQLERFEMRCDDASSSAGRVPVCIDSPRAELMADVLRVNATLETLMLRNMGITGSAMRHLALGLRGNKRLHTIDFSRNPIGDVGSAHLASALRASRAVLKLFLQSCSIQELGIEHLVSAMKDVHTVQSLVLSFNTVGCNGAQMIGKLLADEDCVLKELSLEYADLGDMGFRDMGTWKMLDGLRNNTSLTSLFLRGNPLGDGLAEHFGDILSENVALEYLDLSDTGMESIGLRLLACGCMHNATLDTLILNDNDFGDEASMFTLKHLVGADNLKLLKMNCCKVTLEGFNLICEVLRDIVSKRFGPELTVYTPSDTTLLITANQMEIDLSHNFVEPEHSLGNGCIYYSGMPNKTK